MGSKQLLQYDVVGLSVGTYFYKECPPLQASIDQVEGLLTFEKGSEELLQWDERIHTVCAALNGIIDSAAARHAATASA